MSSGKGEMKLKWKRIEQLLSTVSQLSVYNKRSLRLCLSFCVLYSTCTTSPVFATFVFLSLVFSYFLFFFFLLRLTTKINNSFLKILYSFYSIFARYHSSYVVGKPLTISIELLSYMIMTKNHQTWEKRAQ